MIGTIILIITIAFTAFIIWFAIKAKKLKKETKETAEMTLSGIEDFIATKKYISCTGPSIAIDNSSRKICLIIFDKKAIYKGKDILQCNVTVNGITTLSQSTSDTIGRSILGGIIGGGAGAIVGGASSKQTQKQEVTSIILEIIVNNLDEPRWTINFIDSSVFNDTQEYFERFDLAKQWHSMISVLINQASVPEPKGYESKADEIRKLKQLFDENIISEIEFENEKLKILNK